MAYEENHQFGRLYDRTYDRVLAYALVRASREDALDAVAETFHVAWRRRTDIPRDPLPWLLVVARNTLSQQRRSGRRADALHAELCRLELLAPTGEGDVSERVTERLTVLQALATLSDTDREALMLSVWDGLSTYNAATVAGCSPAAFGVRLHRARKRLAKILATLGQ